MASLNKWIGIGHLGADPESRYLPNGEQVVTLRLACSETWKDKATGEKKESTEWVRVVCWRKLAEIASRWLKKNQLIYIEGAMKTRKWTDSQGVERYSTEIQADQMKMLGGKPEQRSEPAASGAAPASAPSGHSGAPKPAADEFDDDIPF